MIALTGYSGFVGQQLLRQLSDHQCLLLGRKQPSSDYPFCEFDLGSADSANTFLPLSDVTTLVHLAARVHILNDISTDPLTEFRIVNTEGTLNLARQAAQAGVKRFIFLSTIGVNGVSNTSPFSISDELYPVGNDAVSKLEAEIGLQEIAAETDMEVVIIRPPLVYGPNAPGNFAKLAKLANKNLPLPLGAIHNKRSFVGLDNLVDLIVTCINNPNAANQTFLVSDDHDVSITELLTTMIKAAGKNPRLLPVPVYLIRLVGKFTGKIAVVGRLCDNLQVDISHTKKTLGWTPPVSFKDGISKCFNKE
tara:strand:+ start:12041 stop:12961 length:921 start_codon:yes stop_codon:yes gene_type:complete